MAGARETWYLSMFGESTENCGDLKRKIRRGPWYMERPLEWSFLIWIQMWEMVSKQFLMKNEKWNAHFLLYSKSAGLPADLGHWGQVQEINGVLPKRWFLREQPFGPFAPPFCSWYPWSVARWWCPGALPPWWGSLFDEQMSGWPMSSSSGDCCWLNSSDTTAEHSLTHWWG